MAKKRRKADTIQTRRESKCSNCMCAEIKSRREVAEKKVKELEAELQSERHINYRTRCEEAECFAKQMQDQAKRAGDRIDELEADLAKYRGQGRSR